ncbi:Cell division cycle protein 123 [Phytophthora cinnamomi]|uniref:Cell division cycle protein 123 n=1 Tax=Phytophthora cinnamomi TaxID=4785 RepID=UPI00355A47E0|nr:Cell division cycle protein 123 [Phytophthora cinnamomi]
MATTGDACPTYSAAQVDNCAFAAWYPQLKRVAIKGEVVLLPAAFVSLLLSDGVTLPSAPVASGIEDEDESDEEEDATSALTDDQLSAISTVREQVERVLRDFGGKLFPKTNWSAPRDAAWMLGSLKCTSFEDLFLLLQASDFVVHDLTQPYVGCGDSTEKTELAPRESYLVLKKWCNFLDSMLFRCFVVGHRLVAVSQRNCDEFYEFLPDQQDELCELLYEFYKTNFMKPEGEFVFPNPDYSFDVYVDKRRRVYLLDINVFGAVTDTLLFSWEELLELRTGSPATPQDAEDEGHVVDFRVVESKKGIRANPLSGYRAPTDLVDHLTGGAGFDAFIEQVKRDNAACGDDSDSSDEAN